jgi:hypothetical protein
MEMKADRKGGTTCVAGGTHIKFTATKGTPMKTKVMKTSSPSFLYPSTAKKKS